MADAREASGDANQADKTPWGRYKSSDRGEEEKSFI
jgi:hypothetical protein